MANDIKFFNTSTCSNYLAIATLNNTVTVFNRKYGLANGCVAFNSSILQLHFVDKYVGNKLTDMNLACDNVSILVQCETGQLYIIVMNISGLIKEPVCIYDSANGLEMMPYYIELVPSLPELVLLIFCEGPILVHSMVEKKTLCQLAIPELYQLFSCNFPTFGSKQTALLAIYRQLENLSNKKAEQKAFIYELWTYNELNMLKSLTSKDIIKSIISTKTESAMVFKQILQNQEDTKEKLKNVWKKLKNIDLKKIDKTICV